MWTLLWILQDGTCTPDELYSFDLPLQITQLLLFVNVNYFLYNKAKITFGNLNQNKH